MSTVIGFRQPQRIIWYNTHGDIIRVDSIPYDKDPEEYAVEMRRIEGHNHKYTVEE